MKKLILYLGFLFLLQACYKDIGPIDDPDVPGDQNVSFSADVQPIFDSHCVSCHPSSGNLDLRSGYSYNNLVNRPASGYNGILVVPGDANASVLYKKIDGSGAYGSNMPLGGSLSSAQIEIIRRWIDEGARNN
jgi:mono/diheme cytochrome c family protein